MLLFGCLLLHWCFCCFDSFTRLVKTVYSDSTTAWSSFNLVKQNLKDKYYKEMHNQITKLLQTC